MDMSVCVVVVLAMVFSGVDAKFVCNRDTTQCKNTATCNTATYKCDACDTFTFQGDACNVKADGCTAASTCMNGATCYNDGTDDKCLCTDDFVGATCTDHRYKLECDYANSKMKITIQAQVPTFSGKMYVSGKKATCLITNNALKDIAHVDTACGDASSTGVTPNQVFTRVVIVQYNDNAVVPTDELVTFKCGENAQFNLDDSSVAITTVAGTLIEIEKNNKAVLSDVSMVRNPAGAAVDFGADVTITISLTQAGKDNGFQDLNIMTCEGREQVSNAVVQFKLIEDHCPVVAAYGVLKKDGSGKYITRTTAERSFIFKAFQPTSATVVFTDLVISCTVIVCQNLADCFAILHTCTPAVNEANGRRKRESGTKETHLNVTLSIRNPLFDYQASQQDVGDKECYQSMEMTAAVVALGVALVIVLVICMFLTVKVILYRKSPSYNEKL